MKQYLLFYRALPEIQYKEYTNIARIYLDEYPEQKELRKEFFAKRRNLQNEALKRWA